MNDFLPGFECEKLNLQADNYHSNPQATLVWKKAVSPKKAILYVHGYADYFFQEELANKIVDKDISFYALDLRRYGRSIVEGDPLYLVDEVETYFEEINLAVFKIMNENPEVDLYLMGHSTGGLITLLYSHFAPSKYKFKGLILNSPFIEFKANWWQRLLLLPFARFWGKRIPRFIIPFPEEEVKLYLESLHSSYKGEWNFNPTWRPLEKKHILYAGWMEAVSKGHQRVKDGLNITHPILLMSSKRSGGGSTWNESYTNSDCVLNVEHMRDFAKTTLNNVTLKEVEGGLHDLFLSAPKVREEAYSILFNWLDA